MELLDFDRLQIEPELFFFIEFVTVWTYTAFTDFSFHWQDSGIAISFVYNRTDCFFFTATKSGSRTVSEWSLYKAMVNDI